MCFNNFCLWKYFRYLTEISNFFLAAKFPEVPFPFVVIFFVKKHTFCVIQNEFP